MQSQINSYHVNFSIIMTVISSLHKISLIFITVTNNFRIARILGMIVEETESGT
jgi:hypothetical protein